MSTGNPITDKILNETKGVNLPGWFLKVMAACASLLTVGGIPWASWVTYTLIQIEARDDNTRSNQDRIANLERAKQDHDARLAVIDATKFTSENARLLTTGIESRLDRLETKFDTLQRDFDRTFSKREPQM